MSKTNLPRTEHTITTRLGAPCQKCGCETGSDLKPCHVTTTHGPGGIENADFHCARCCPSCSGLFSGLEEALTV